MISVVLYGRNDNYGYNLHKRAALSLNCIAEVLSDDDEILFVDYNTPDDYPTFPEAIADTLTDKARQLLRIFRVRASTHERLFAGKTHLKTIEPVARNVAVKRSNPKSKWILSTNTDLIFIPNNGTSLSEKISQLEDGYYITARFEIPESVWETFPRLDPKATIETTRRLSSSMHLRNVVKGSEYNLYDGPGDYQLILREDLFEMNGFDERMLLGWHVDSNISKRLFMKYGKVGDGMEHVFGFHCDHTRQITPAHEPNAKFNDPFKFVENLKQPEVLNQADGRWGLADEPIQELQLNKEYFQFYTNSVLEVLQNEPVADTFSTYSSHTFNKTKAEPRIVIPFLMDMVLSQPRDIKIGWLGDKGEVYSLFNDGLKRFGFEKPILEINTQTKTQYNQITFVIVNFGMPEMVTGNKANKLNDDIYTIVRSILDDNANIIGPKFIGINCLHNRFEETMRTYFACGRTPFAPRILHGFIQRTTADDNDTEGIATNKIFGGNFNVLTLVSAKKVSSKLNRPNFLIQAVRIWLLSNHKIFGSTLILMRLAYRFGVKARQLRKLLSTTDLLLHIRVSISKILIFCVLLLLIGGLYSYVS